MNASDMFDGSGDKLTHTKSDTPIINLVIIDNNPPPRNILPSTAATQAKNTISDRGRGSMT